MVVGVSLTTHVTIASPGAKLSAVIAVDPVVARVSLGVSSSSGSLSFFRNGSSVVFFRWWLFSCLLRSLLWVPALSTYYMGKPAGTVIALLGLDSLFTQQRVVVFTIIPQAASWASSGAKSAIWFT